MIKKSGFDKNGAVAALITDLTHSDCREYLTEGFTPQNPLLKGTGYLGADVGAFPVAPSGGGSSNNAAWFLVRY